MKNFDQYRISTQTLIISTNLQIDCQKFYDSIECIPISKPLSNKSRMVVNKDDDIKDGSIVQKQYKNNSSGAQFKKNSEKFFLNSVTIVMKINIKYINIKVSNKGKLQITGCNDTVPIHSILEHFWEMIQKDTNIWTFNELDEDKFFKAMIIPVMNNINFSIDYQINRETLNTVINTQTNFISILEPSDGYVGVNIKITATEEPLENIFIDEYQKKKEGWVLCKKRFMEYIKTLNPKEQKKKLSKCHVNTFLVFYSGKVIMSGGISYVNRKNAFDTFINIIDKYKNTIQN